MKTIKKKIKSKDKQKYIVRCDRAGVFFGEIKSKSKDTITMTNVQKVFYWSGACAIEELAKEGSTEPNNCKLTVIIDEMIIANPIQIISCTKKATKQLNSITIWKKS